MVTRIAVLGSTGSVGTNALRLIEERPDALQAVLLTAHRSADSLASQSARFRPAAACLAAEDAEVPAGCGSDGAGGTAWFTGAEGLLEALEHAAPDLVLNAITGAAGLRASEWTIRRGLPLALANKESLVMAGAWLMPLARETGATILPVDSEHCAIHQCMRGESAASVRRIHLTGSGGPFRTRALDSFDAITPAEALRHPTWDMGPRITIGSATMMNKAFEILEAHWLFDLDPDQIEVVIHPQSIVHSMVEFIDGSIMAQLGVPDMRVPILYCLTHPHRTAFGGFEPFDPVRFANLEFEPVDTARFPAIPLAFDTIRRGGDSGAVLNAADEVMTGLFLEGAVSFPTITRVVSEVLHSTPVTPIRSLDDVIRADHRAREAARAAVHAAQRSSES